MRGVWGVNTCGGGRGGRGDVGGDISGGSGRGREGGSGRTCDIGGCGSGEAWRELEERDHSRGRQVFVSRLGTRVTGGLCVLPKRGIGVQAVDVIGLVSKREGNKLEILLEPNLAREDVIGFNPEDCGGGIGAGTDGGEKLGPQWKPGINGGPSNPT